MEFRRHAGQFSKMKVKKLLNDLEFRDNTAICQQKLLDVYVVGVFGSHQLYRWIDEKLRKSSAKCRQKIFRIAWIRRGV